MVKIFISHSSNDSAIAKLVADLLRTAMCLSKSDIRCTSVDGYRLPAGAITDEQLRREVLEAQVLIGLISHQSFESAYVLFELGARWGTKSYMVPLLTPGVSTSILKGPLSGLNALSCDSNSQIHQLVTDVASELDNVTLEPPASYQDQVDSLARYKIDKSENKTFIINLTFDQRSGTLISTKDKRLRYCHKCFHDTPSKEIELREFAEGWQCSVCGKNYSNPDWHPDTMPDFENDY